MFHLCYVFKLIVDRFYNCPFSKQEFVRYGHECSFHVALKLCDKLYTVNGQSFKKIFNISGGTYQILFTDIILVQNLYDNIQI